MKKFYDCNKYLQILFIEFNQSYHIIDPEPFAKYASWQIHPKLLNSKPVGDKKTHYHQFYLTWPWKM